jgi:hypothetical protein
MPVVRATLWSILGAYLLLPVGTKVDLPMIPPLDKVTVPNLAAFFVCRMVLGKRVSLFPKQAKARGLLMIYIASPFMTALLNGDPVVSGPLYIAGMDYHDALSAVIRQLLFILPFLLGLQFFRTEKSLEEMLMVLVVAGLWYSLPMLFEVRLSPQLHTWIYGYFPHSFLQQMRDGGFRPVVFMGHGLWVAFFTMTALVSAVAFWRIRRSPVRQLSSGIVVAYLTIVLVLCKSMASLVYAVFLAFWIKFVKPGFQVRLAMVMVLIALSYPLTRGLGWFPVQQISDLAASVSVDRAKSLDFRMRNEDMLLHKANQRPLFGWGTWGRNRIYDPTTGRDISVTDGRWIQVIGQFGWVGLLAEFGLLALPVIRSAKLLRYTESRREAIILAAVSLILSISLLDLLPNNTMSPFTWLMAGALLARVESLKIQRQKDFLKS